MSATGKAASRRADLITRETPPELRHALKDMIVKVIDANLPPEWANLVHTYALMYGIHEGDTGINLNDYCDWVIALDNLLYYLAEEGAK